MNEQTAGRPDHNSLGKASGIIGIVALIMSFIPIIGFVSWILAPLAILFGLVALRKIPRSMAIVGLIAGAIALIICFSWLNATESMGEAMSADTFNTTGETRDMSDAPIMEANIKEVWSDLEANKVAAGQKYGGNRLSFTDEQISDFGGDASNPTIHFVGKAEQYISQQVSAGFSEADGQAIGQLSKGGTVSFVCSDVNETFGDGYNLSGCSLR